MPAARKPPRYVIIEFEGKAREFDSVAAALEDATKAHQMDRTRGFAVVELIAIVSSEHKTLVTRVK